MPFRYKNVSRFKEQVCQIRDAYGYSNIRISDYILPRQYNAPEAVEILRESECNFSSEMKSNLKRIDTQRLRRAGFVDVQIGVESFCDQTLQIISKGVTALQNIQAIRFLNEEGISAAYNIIHGFSDDEEAHFEELTLNLWRLYHLSPPASFVRLAFTADAPICKKLQEEGAVEVHPFYDLVYPTGQEWAKDCNRKEIAYYFEGSRPEESNAIREFRSEVREWRRAHSRGARLEVRKSNGSGIVEDTRRGKKRYRLSQSQWRTLGFVGDNIVNVEAITNQVPDGEEVVQWLWDFGLIYRLGSRVVSLVRTGPCGLRDVATGADTSEGSAELANGLAPAAASFDQPSTRLPDATP